ncbi:MAG: MgtC/SapB family protein [Deltaproteobacteria bacterium]|nr:MgtC/SapB family protein [Deltaproteobacteria bacterium]
MDTGIPFIWILKLLAAILCGAVIGIEREIHRKAAGLRTNILICFGSALYMLSGELIMRSTGMGNPDPTRIAGQIVTGIGFIGAGSIMQARGHVMGLTTAATIWVVAGIGIAVGAGYILFGIAVSVMILLLLIGVGHFEYLIMGKCRISRVRISFRDPTGETRSAISDILNACNKKIEDFSLTCKNEITFMDLEFCEVHPRHKEFIFEIFRLPDVRATRYNP